jgi:hypothetical protein
MLALIASLSTPLPDRAPYTLIQASTSFSSVKSVLERLQQQVVVPFTAELFHLKPPEPTNFMRAEAITAELQ